jgi:hypothetical protein
MLGCRLVDLISICHVSIVIYKILSPHNGCNPKNMKGKKGEIKEDWKKEIHLLLSYRAQISLRIMVARLQSSAGYSRQLKREGDMADSST